MLEFLLAPLYLNLFLFLFLFLFLSYPISVPISFCLTVSDICDLEMVSMCLIVNEGMNK